MRNTRLFGLTRTAVTLLLVLIVCAVALPVTAWAAENVSYLDETGTGQVVSAEAVTSNMVTWGEDDGTGHWYVVQDTVEINQRVTVTGKVHLILADGASLTVNGGIDVSESNSLSIYGQEQGSGKLIADVDSKQSSAGIGGGYRGSVGTIAIAGGIVTATGGSDGAGIGGSYYGLGGTLTITGGTVTATGGSNGGAGIGGGYRGSGGAVDIAGGTVTATGGFSGGAGIGGGSLGSDVAVTITGGTVAATGGSPGGAGIGGGRAGSGGSVAITGGTVTATGDSGGAGIGAGEAGYDVTFSTGEDGHAVIFASSNGYKGAISDQSGKESDWSGVIFENGVGKVYGTDVAPTEDFTVPKDGALEVPNGATLIIGEGVTATVPEGAIVNNSGSIAGDGALDGDGIVYVVDGGSVSVADCSVKVIARSVAYVDEQGEETQTANETDVSIIGSDSTSWGADDDAEHWYVVQGEVNIGRRVTVSGKVHLILADGCNLTVTGGIYVPQNSSLTIYGQDGGTGKLVADASNALGAGIGGNSSEASGSVIIAGGVVTAFGSQFGSAGIGGGSDGSCNVTIAGGTVTARGGAGGAGVGGGSLGTDGVVNITGGAVTATGGDPGGAGIGGGKQRGRVAVTITGGDVKAQGNTHAAGIGGGSGVGGNVTITGGSVTATGGLDGAGIGGGEGATSGTVAIRGGSVTATGGASYGVAVNGIGDGAYGSGSTFSTGENGNAVIIASSIGDNDDKSGWSGVIFENGEGEVYGSDVTPTEDFTIPADHALTVPDGSGLTVAEGVTMTNEGSVGLAKGCTFTNNGALVNDGTFTIKVGAQASGEGKIDASKGITKAVPTATASVSGITDTSFTVSAKSEYPTGDPLYAVVEGTAQPSDNDWQKSGKFTGLEPGTRYTVYVRYTGTDYYEAAVGMTTVWTAKATQPLAADQVSATAETAAGASDGTISVSGLAEGATWEWRAAGGDEWTAAEGATVDGLAPGAYEVRLADSAHYTASAPVSATVQSFADAHGGITFPAGSTDTGDGAVVLPEGGGTVTLPGGSSVTLPGGTVVDPGAGTATLPEQSGTVTLSGGSTVTVPGGSVVDLPSGAVTAPDGTTVAPSGDGELGVTFPNGETVTVPSGSAADGNGAVTTPDGSVVKPNGLGGITVTLPDGTELAAPSGSTVSADGTVLDPSGNRVEPETPGKVDDGPKDDDSESDDTSKNDDAPGLAGTGDATTPVAGAVMAGLTALLAGLALRPRRR